VHSLEEIQKNRNDGFTTRFRAKDKSLKKVLEIKMAGADIKCLYVKTSKSDVTKDMIKSGKNILKSQLSFVITVTRLKKPFWTLFYTRK
jgi:hypothetical protein